MTITISPAQFQHLQTQTKQEAQILKTFLKEFGITVDADSTCRLNDKCFNVVSALVINKQKEIWTFEEIDAELKKQKTPLEKYDLVSCLSILGGNKVIVEASADEGWSFNCYALNTLARQKIDSEYKAAVTPVVNMMTEIFQRNLQQAFQQATQPTAAEQRQQQQTAPAEISLQDTIRGLQYNQQQHLLLMQLQQQQIEAMKLELAQLRNQTPSASSMSSSSSSNAMNANNLASTLPFNLFPANQQPRGGSMPPTSNQSQTRDEPMSSVDHYFR